MVAVYFVKLAVSREADDNSRNYQKDKAATDAASVRDENLHIAIPSDNANDRNCQNDRPDAFNRISVVLK